MNEGFDRRQLKAMCYVASLAPVTRLLPKLTALIAGKAGWLAPLFAVPPLLLFLFVYSYIMKKRRAGEGMAELVLRRAPRGFAVPALALIAVFFLFSAGFILRSGAHRLTSTIYPSSGPQLFIAVMLLLGGFAALGPVKALPRASRVFSPLLTAVILLVLALSARSVRLENLLPLYPDELGETALSSLAVAEIYGGVLFAASFLEYASPLCGGRFRSFALWLLPILALLTVGSAVIVGCYGANLTARFSHPFFSLIRDVALPKAAERIEAPVVALWILSDFVIFTLLLSAASHIAAKLLGRGTRRSGAVTLVCAALCAAAAGVMPESDAGLDIISHFVVPGASLVMLFALLPALALSCRRAGG